jgi:hypothetical protein
LFLLAVLSHSILQTTADEHRRSILIVPDLIPYLVRIQPGITIYVRGWNRNSEETDTRDVIRICRPEAEIENVVPRQHPTSPVVENDTGPCISGEMWAEIEEEQGGTHVRG